MPAKKVASKSTSEKKTPSKKTSQKEVVPQMLSAPQTVLSIYVPKPKVSARPIERLIALSKKEDRSVNYLVVEAILRFLDKVDE